MGNLVRASAFFRSFYLVGDKKDMWGEMAAEAGGRFGVEHIH
jgi:hypothetical protein